MTDLQQSVDREGAHAEIKLTRLFGGCPATDQLAGYKAQLREWAVSYLTQPHPELGREGPVCPFTAASMNKNLFLVGCLDGAGLTARHIEESLSAVVARFRSLPPTEGPDAQLKTVLILLPDVTDFRVIDEAQVKLKAESVPHGLMVGQFYPGCAEPGIRNPDFRPLQSPVALLAIRHMMGSDLPFLATRPDWVAEYLKRFKPPARFSGSDLAGPRTGAQGAKVLTGRAGCPGD